MSLAKNTIPIPETCSQVFGKGVYGNMTGKISDKFATDDFRDDSIELVQEDVDVDAESEFYCDVYKELVEIVGAATTRKLWKHYHGLTIQFPQRLYSRTYSRDFVRENMETMTTKEMATQLSLTDRRVRQISREIRRDER